MNKTYNNLPLRSGVGIVLLNKKNKIFVAKRIDNPKNYWQMPQGGLDTNEDYLSAALRELEEETSIKSVELLKEIDEENDDFRIKTETDNQLKYAIKLLKG